MSGDRGARGTGHGAQHAVRGPSCPMPHVPGPRFGSLYHVLALCSLLVATTGCEWFTDFKRQPNIVTWESWRTDTLGVRGQPQGSVPTDGTVAPAWMVSYAPTIAAIDSMMSLNSE